MLEPLPTRCGTHERRDSGDVLFEGGVAELLREPLVVTIPAPSLRQNGIALPQFS